MEYGQAPPLNCVETDGYDTGRGAGATQRAMQESRRLIDWATDSGGQCQGFGLPSPKPGILVFLVRVMDCYSLRRRTAAGTLVAQTALKGHNQRKGHLDGWPLLFAKALQAQVTSFPQ
jgi:hypothetical protein